MTPRDVKRAARALFDIVRGQNAVEPATASLESLSALVAEHPDLQKALESPFVPATAKRGIIDALAPQLSMPDAVQRTLHVLADEDVLNHLPAFAVAVRQLANRHAGIVDASVTTALPLSQAQVERLRTALSSATGKNVVVTPKVDPSVIGGVVARVGGVVFDGTLSRQLARLQEQLVQRG